LRITATFRLVNTQTYKFQYRTECHWQARLGQGNVIKTSIRMLVFVFSKDRKTSQISKCEQDKTYSCVGCVSDRLAVCTWASHQSFA
jgi:hypothetical protein